MEITSLLQSYFIARGKKTRFGEDTGSTPQAGANLEGATMLVIKVMSTHGE